MQFGIFRKAAVLNDSDEPKKASDSDEKPPQKKSKAKKAMDVDSEEEVVLPKKNPFKKRPKKADSDSEDDPKPRAKAKKGSGKKEESKEGWVLKKKRKSVFNQWDKRYLSL